MKAALMIAVSTLALMIGQAHAALIPENGLTLDTTTGLEWIDAQTTDGYSPAAILAGAGGFLAEGWQYATVDQWDTLMETYIGPGGPTTNNTVGLQSAVLPEYFLSGYFTILTLGMNISFNDPRANDDITSIPIYDLYEVGTQGWLQGLSGQPGIGTLTAGIGFVSEYEPANLPLGTPFGGWETNFEASNSDDINGAPNVASFLVRAAPSVRTPEPATVLIFVVGLLGLGFLQSRKS